MCNCLGVVDENCVCRDNATWNAAIREAMLVVQRQVGRKSRKGAMIVQEVAKLIEPSYDLVKTRPSC